jgi:hypothetical protein
VWEKLHELLLAELHAADRPVWERAVADSNQRPGERDTAAVCLRPLENSLS